MPRSYQAVGIGTSEVLPRVLPPLPPAVARGVQVGVGILVPPLPQHRPRRPDRKGGGTRRYGVLGAGGVLSSQAFVRILKKMGRKVSELRGDLRSHGLPTSGTRSVLLERLEAYRRTRAADEEKREGPVSRLEYEEFRLKHSRALATYNENMRKLVAVLSVMKKELRGLAERVRVHEDAFSSACAPPSPQPNSPSSEPQRPESDVEQD